MSQLRNTQQHPNVEITVRNFGPIAEAAIDLRPLTVFIGPSNTGKTYFSTLVYALHGVFNGFGGFPTPIVQDWLPKIAHDLVHASSGSTSRDKGNSGSLYKTECRRTSIQIFGPT